MWDSSHDDIEMAGPGEPGDDSGDSDVTSHSDHSHQMAVPVLSGEGSVIGALEVHRAASPAEVRRSSSPADIHPSSSPHDVTDANLNKATELVTWGALHNLSEDAMQVVNSCGGGTVEELKDSLLERLGNSDVPPDVREEILAVVKCLNKPCAHEVTEDVDMPPVGQVPRTDDPESDSSSESESDPHHMIDTWAKLHNLDDNVLTLLKQLGFFTLDRVADLTEIELVKLGVASDLIQAVSSAIQCLRMNGPCPHVESQTSEVAIAESWDARFGINVTSDMKMTGAMTSVNPMEELTTIIVDPHLDTWATLHDLDKILLVVLQRLGYVDLEKISKLTQDGLDRLGVPEVLSERLMDAISCLKHDGPCPHTTAAVVTKSLDSMDLDEDARKDRPKSRYGKGLPQLTSGDETNGDKSGVPEDNIITFTKDGDATILRRFHDTPRGQKKEMMQAPKTDIENFAQAQILEVLHGLAARSGVKPGELHAVPAVASKDAILGVDRDTSLESSNGEDELTVPDTRSDVAMEPDPLIRSVSRMLDESEANLMQPEPASPDGHQEELERPHTAVNMNPLLLHNFSVNRDTKADISASTPSRPSVPSPSSPKTSAGRGRSRGNTPPDSRMTDVDNSEEDFDTGQPEMMAAVTSMGPDQSRLDMLGGGPGKKGPQKLTPQQKQQFMDDEEDDDDDGSDTDDDDDDDDDDEDDDEAGVALEGAYDPGDYDHLPVSPEIKELFQYITRYTPQAIELEHKLKPFIPDFIPAVGDIDAFIKITRPDNAQDEIGLKVLDEPCAKQSDPTVLDLHLRSISKQTNLKAMSIKSVQNAEKNPKAIDSWIESITELHRSKPPPNVHYTKNMPDIETLMQEWPPEFEDLLKEVGLPTAEIDCDLATYVDMICAILDIPVHKSKIQSLHVLFTLYSEFKNSQHFKSLAEGNQIDNSLKGMDFMGDGGNEDRLVL